MKTKTERTCPLCGVPLWVGPSVEGVCDQCAYDALTEGVRDLSDTYRRAATPTPTPRYPTVTVHLGDLDGPDGNAFAILGRVRRALREAGVPEHETATFFDVATAGTYEDLLAAVRRWVAVT